VLAIDTATTLCGVAVVEKGQGLANQRSAVRRQAVSTHSEMLLSLISDCLSELELDPGALSAVVCGAGPGSFTGLRIGIATAKGLCFGLSVPLVLVSSLQALGAGVNSSAAEPRPVLATLNAFRGQVFARLLVPAGYTPSPALHERLVSHPALTTDAVWDPAALAALLTPCASELLLCGGGLLSYPLLHLPGAKVVVEDPFPHPLTLLQLGLGRLQAGEQDLLATATPNYICASAAEDKGARPVQSAAQGPWTP
jgi:tRNA threonylcarbamoyladenosine biosynthesis protein TsaB